MDRATFEVAYDGQAVRDGTMDVYRIAPVFVALGDLFSEVNNTLNRDRASVNVKLKAGARPGSIEVAFELATVLSDQIQAGGVDPVAVVTAHEMLVNIGFWSEKVDTLFGIIQWLNGEEPKEVEHLEGESVKMTNQRGDNMIINGDVYNLYGSRGVRRSAHQLVRPAEQKGIDEFQARREGKVVRRVRKDEVENFKYDEDEETVEETTRTKWVKVTRCVWDENRRWEFYDGNEKFSAVIEDPSFWRQVHARVERFGEGDDLHVRVLERQMRTANGELKKEQKVLEVSDHKKAPVQTDLLEDVDEENG